jgi:hypothetical protein
VSTERPAWQGDDGLATPSIGTVARHCGAGLFVGVVVGMTADACCSPFHYGRDWNFWWFTAVVELQAALAAWIMWSVFERGPRPLLRDLSVVFVGSFIPSPSPSSSTLSSIRLTNSASEIPSSLALAFSARSCSSLMYNCFLTTYTSYTS